jgi:hypothetical protein
VQQLESNECACGFFPDPSRRLFMVELSERGESALNESLEIAGLSRPFDLQTDFSMVELAFE